MATTHSIVQQSAGDGLQPQTHSGSAGPSLISVSEQQLRFMTPTNSSTVRPSPPGTSVAGGPLSRPLLGSPPCGPSPLFPPQAVMSLPPQAGGMTLPPFSRLPPPSGPPSGPQIPPTSQPPPVQMPPPTCPPNLPPPTGVPMRPPVSSPLSQFPPECGPHDPQALQPLPNIRPPAMGPPTTPPSAPTSGPPPLSGAQNLPPPGGLQVSPPPNISPASVAPPQTASGQSTPSPGNFRIHSPGIQIPPTSGPPSANPHPPSQSPHSGPPPVPSPVQLPPPGSTQQAPTLPSPTQNTLSSPSPNPPLLPSPQQTKGDSVKSEVAKSSEVGRGQGGREVWYEHKISDGRVYYSHSVTRKTTWDRPQNAQVMPHPGQQQSPAQAPSPSPTGTQTAPPRHPFSGIPPPGVPNASHLVPSHVWSEFQTPEGKPYFYNKITRVSVWERPKDIDLVMPLPPELGAPNLAPRAQHPPSQRLPHTHSPGTRPPLISPPLMFPPGQPPFNSGFPPGHPGQPAMNPGVPPHVTHYPPPTHLLNTPPGGLESSGDMQQAGETEEMELDNHTNPSGGGEASESGQPVEPKAAAAAEGEKTDKEGSGVPGAGDSSTAAPEPIKEEPKGPRPIASIPVPGTPWSVVWTSDNRQFFFDVTSRVSLWMMPEELRDNPLLQQILENGPDTNRVPPAKRIKVGEGGSGRGEEGEEEEDEMEDGAGGLDIPTGTQVTAPVKSEVMETEKTAAMMRSGKTLEQRQDEFKDMLLERGVSAFSTWDKELPKFVFDPRYMLLSARERKSCFEEFIRSRAEEERKEKRSKLKAKKDEFTKLLDDSKLHPKSSFSEFAQRNARDERFKAVEKMREREQLFSEYLQELKKAAVTTAASGGKHRGEKSSDSGSAHNSSKTKPDKVKSDFLQLLSEDHSLSESSQWRKVKGGLERDPRYRAVTGGSSQREEWFKEYIRSLASSSKQQQQQPVDPSREREERIQASLKEREREVKMSRSAHEKEWGRERDQLRKTEAVQRFKAMLADTIRTTGIAWNDARRQLRQDARWDSTGLLELEEKERLFQEHCDGLTERKRLQFRRLLEETSQISLVMPWKKAKKLIRDDPRYKNFTESDHRREVEYDKHLRDKMVMAKNEFRSLLRETKIINYKSHKLVSEAEKHYKEIIEVLNNDRRYLVLECVADERERILQGYMEELHLRGPPPPPTATNPSERLRKLP